MFPLVRYFSVTSFVVFMLGFILIFDNARTNDINDLIDLREQNNIALTQAYANTILNEHGDFIASAATMAVEDITASSEFMALDTDIRQLTEGSTIVKVKIYAPNGLTIYSSEASLIGEDKSDNPGFIAALGGGVASALEYKDNVNTFEGTIEVRDIVESYVSIEPAGTNEIKGVIELYDDVTVLLAEIEARQIRLGIGLASLLTVLYLILFFIVRYAEQIMRKQRKQIEDNLKELALTNNQLKVANERAEEATRLKSEFLSTMSHELRTPLNSIIGYSGIISSGMSGNVDEKAMRMVTRIQDSGQHLLMLINNILDISKIEAGRLTIVKENTVIRDLCDSLEEQLEVLANKKQLNFEILVADKVPNSLIIDGDRVTQVLINLLSNAIKFTEQGTVKLDVSYESTNLIMKVTDTGLGIPAHSLDYIFDEFRQVDGSSTRSTGGTGLGLAIVRKFTEAMDGSVNVESTLGKGSLFTVTIPAEITEPETAPAV